MSNYTAYKCLNHNLKKNSKIKLVQLTKINLTSSQSNFLYLTAGGYVCRNRKNLIIIIINIKDVIKDEKLRMPSVTFFIK
jgi:hypothetical protein